MRKRKRTKLCVDHLYFIERNAKKTGRFRLLLVAVLFTCGLIYSQDPPVRPSSQPMSGGATVEEAQAGRKAYLASHQPMSRDSAFQALLSTNRSERLRGVQELGAEKTQVIKQLLEMLGSTDSNAAKVDAVIILGQYRANEAVPSLVRHFELDDVYPTLRGGVFDDVAAAGP